MQIKPIELRIANEFITQHHRHSKKVTGHKFSIGLWENGELIGVVVAGRPIARMLDNGRTLEAIRVCVKEGYPNACSKLYGRIKAIGQLMGYEKIITYTLKRESQSSLKAIGAVQEKEVIAQEWTRPSRERINQKVYTENKIRWDLTGENFFPTEDIISAKSK